tara:strand:- start:1164 stop:1355 length:192 start_codon:yes stop_codon:yes gene_type:complete
VRNNELIDVNFQKIIKYFYVIDWQSSHLTSVWLWLFAASSKSIDLSYEKVIPYLDPPQISFWL